MKPEHAYVWRRAAARVSVSLPVRWGADESCLHKGLLTSLSTHGALVEAQVASLPCERVYLRLPDGAGGQLTLAADVAYYVAGRGLAVEFVVGAGEREALARLVEGLRAGASKPQARERKEPNADKK